MESGLQRRIQIQFGQCVWKLLCEYLLPLFATAHDSRNRCEGIRCHRILHIVIPYSDPRHHCNPEVRTRRSSATCVATHDRAPRSHFSACSIPRFVTDRDTWDNLERKLDSLRVWSN
ncbi:hypothetical protein TNCV_619521 [Trichonephila clavipes]|uniref:Uncharacterized protein n=1 Tax=Trichonephila clavipes TaxID=2585209 RepID=A0A8X6UZY9_TRICX|nr:hypothetical protein TNCV_619521 [Trichonephila clavipes]